jgi:hypothetical protein
MPQRELKYPAQIEDWLMDWGKRLAIPGALILIGSGGLLWHAGHRGLTTALPENSMDVDPITRDDAVAELAYDAIIGSDFEREHGWHVNLMPNSVMSEFSRDWETRASKKTYGHLAVTVPAPDDLLAPKLRRGEPRDLKHAQWAYELGMAKKT